MLKQRQDETLGQIHLGLGISMTNRNICKVGDSENFERKSGKDQEMIRKIKKIDQISFIFFAIAYILFNFFYFLLNKCVR